MSLYPSVSGPEPSVRIVAQYGGSNASSLRDALLSPQLNVAKVDVVGVTFEITCRTREAAVILINMFPSLSLALEQFHVELASSVVLEPELVS